MNPQKPPPELDIPAEDWEQTPPSVRAACWQLSQQIQALEAEIAPLLGASPKKSSGTRIWAYLVAALIALSILTTAVIFIYLLRPPIDYFEADSTILEAGESTTLSWRASPFVDLRIDPEIGRVHQAQGEVEVTPVYDTVYRLKAENFLTRLNPNWFGDEHEIYVVVMPVDPIIHLDVDKDEVQAGERVTVSWHLEFTDRAILWVNDAPQTIGPGRFAEGENTYTITEDTIFILEAYNAYTPAGNGFAATRMVKVIE